MTKRFTPFGFGKTNIPALMLLLVLAVVTAIRIRLLDLPLERDEGEFAYAGQLIQQGLSPYQHAYNVLLKLPGTCFAYALSMAVLGQTAMAIHTAVILVNLATACLVFVLAKPVCGSAGAVAASGTCALLSINPLMQGFAAHATHFLTLPALAGVVLLQTLEARTSSRRVFFAGLLLGVAVIMKQTAATFALFAAVWITWQEFPSAQRDLRRLATRAGALTAGVLLPFALLLGILALNGDFPQFWFWTIRYAHVHTSIFTLPVAVKWMFECVGEQFLAAPSLWGVAIAGAIFLFCNRSLRRWRFFVSTFAVFSFLAVCPGWYFRGHYFLQMLPALGLLAGIAFSTASAFGSHGRLWFAVVAVTFGVLGTMNLIQWKKIYFQLTPEEASRAMYGSNPFVEAVEVGRYLQLHSADTAYIAVIGSEPQIYFYSRRRSATAYICTYPLMEQQPFAAAMRSEMIRQIEQARPEYVVFVNVPESWVQSTSPPDMSVFEWFDRYQRDNLVLVGVTETMEDNTLRYRWFDSSASAASLPAKYSMAIFRRRANS